MIVGCPANSKLFKLIFRSHPNTLVPHPALGFDSPHPVELPVVYVYPLGLSDNPSLPTLNSTLTSLPDLSRLFSQ